MNVPSAVVVSADTKKNNGDTHEAGGEFGTATLRSCRRRGVVVKRCPLRENLDVSAVQMMVRTRTTMAHCGTAFPSRWHAEIPDDDDDDKNMDE